MAFETLQASRAGYLVEFGAARIRRLVEVGHGDVGCVVSSVARPGGPEAECSFSVMLDGGEISATGLVSFAAATTPGGTFAIPVVGGTGKYRGAKGEISFNVINQTDTWDTFSLS